MAPMQTSLIDLLSLWRFLPGPSPGGGEFAPEWKSGAITGHLALWAKSLLHFHSIPDNFLAGRRD